MKKPMHYIADLKELREKYEQLPATMRRPEICIAEEYTENEVFDCEIQSMWHCLRDRDLAGTLLNIHADNFVDNFEQELEEDPEVSKASLHMALDYSWSMKRLGEDLVKFFIENQLYDDRRKLIGECHGVVDGRWLVIRREPPVQK